LNVFFLVLTVKKAYHPGTTQSRKVIAYQEAFWNDQLDIPWNRCAYEPVSSIQGQFWTVSVLMEIFASFHQNISTVKG
jgi:hypothetical protein